VLAIVRMRKEKRINAIYKTALSILMRGIEIKSLSCKV
jgi:hypothetical protein